MLYCVFHYLLLLKINNNRHEMIPAPINMFKNVVLVGNLNPAHKYETRYNTITQLAKRITSCLALASFSFIFIFYNIVVKK